MNSSDEEVLLESCCFLLNYHQKVIKRKRKRTWMRDIFKKRIEQRGCHKLLQEIVPMIGNRISGYLYNELFSKSNKEKCTTFQSMAWSLIVHKSSIKNWSTALQAFSFWSLSLYPLFYFHKGKDTSAIPKPSVPRLVYVFLIFFRFHKCFNNFHLSKNILINKFIH